MTDANGCILEVKDLSVELQDQTVLDSISFKLKRGTTLAVAGPNGAGKTTLFRALLNLIQYSGKVEWKGKVRIGYVPQKFTVADIPMSVEEFLSIKSKINIDKCLKSVGLDRKIAKRRIDRLSGGEMQRVLVAWAIIDNPDVLLFDEPTLGVDVGSEEHIYEMIDSLKRRYGITILLISHDIHTIKHYSDYLLSLNKVMLFFGKSANILNPALLKRIYGSATILKKHKK